MSKDKLPLLSLFIAVLVFSFTQSFWLFENFKEHDWVSINALISLVEIFTLFLALATFKRSNKGFVFFTVTVVVLCVADLTIEYFGGGFVPNPFVYFGKGMEPYYELVLSNGPQRSLLGLYFVFFLCVNGLFLNKRYSSA